MNFAHGAMAMAAAYTFYELDRVQGWSALSQSFVASGRPARDYRCSRQVIVMRRLREAAPISRLIGTLGVLALLDGLFSKWFGASTNTVIPPILPAGSLHIGSSYVDKQVLCLLGIGGSSASALYAWSKYSAARPGDDRGRRKPGGGRDARLVSPGAGDATWGTGHACRVPGSIAPRRAWS